MVEVARQAGHAPAMTLSTYGHVIEELEGGDRRSAEAVIRPAREANASIGVGETRESSRTVGELRRAQRLRKVGG